MSFDPAPIYPNASLYLDVADKFVKLSAVIVAGLWAWMNYRRGRTYKLRLEPSITGELTGRNGKQYLLITCQIKNVGLSVYKIRERGSGCEILAMPETGRKRLNAFAVFAEHQWIEPGEHISEQILVPVSVDASTAALRLNLRIVSGGIAWNSSSVLMIADNIWNAHQIPVESKGVHA